MHAQGKAKAVEHRQRGKHGIVVRVQVDFNGVLHHIHQFIGQVVDGLAGEHYALGIAGRAAGHHNGSGGLGIGGRFRIAVLGNIRPALL